MKYVIFFIFSFFILFTNLKIIKESYKFITPIFLVNPYVYKIISIFIFLLLTAIIFNELKKINFDISFMTRKFFSIIIMNIICYTLYNIFTFLITSSFLSFLAKSFGFIFSIYLNGELYQNKISTKVNSLYIIWSFYLVLTSISIFFLNS